MFEGRSARTLRQQRLAAAGSLQSSMTKSDILEALESDYKRMLMCMMWVDAARRDWYEGSRQARLAVLRSNDERYAHMNVAARKAAGNTMWSNDPRSKDLAGQEQMYSRWAQTYAAAVAAENAHQQTLQRGWESK